MYCIYVCVSVCIYMSLYACVCVYVHRDQKDVGSPGASYILSETISLAPCKRFCSVADLRLGFPSRVSFPGGGVPSCGSSQVTSHPIGLEYSRLHSLGLSFLFDHGCGRWLFSCHFSLDPCCLRSLCWSCCERGQIYLACFCGYPL